MDGARMHPVACASHVAFKVRTWILDTCLVTVWSVWMDRWRKRKRIRAVEKNETEITFGNVGWKTKRESKTLTEVRRVCVRTGV